ncbi:MAG: GntR family transcriptional regulator [Fusobacteriaceae bacterium]|jgi:DNA-binding GntR family transcriptional regulator|nr:GntR family transcriptional regulator [Fusobacteriaceae bacterium]
MIIEKTKSMREQAYEILRKMILDGEIPPGERIKEIEYSHKFQISRTPIREALRMLELEGLVENNDTGGVIVKKVTGGELRELYRIRIALEDIVLEEVVKYATEEDIAVIERIIRDTAEQMKKKNDKNVFRLFSRFNLELHRISRLQRVTDMVKNMTSYLEQIRRMSIENKDRQQAAFADHSEMLELIKNKDLDRLLDLNHRHLTRSMDFVSKYFGQINEPKAE